jgi:hypothetical protein
MPKKMESLVIYSKVLSQYSFPGSKYGEPERVTGATAYLVTGTYKKAAKVAGIPESTLRDWARQEWWGHLTEEVRTEKESEFQAGFSRIVEKAIGETEDRLDRGEVKLVKTKEGYEERRVPVSAKDAQMISAIAYDKLRLSLNLPTSIKQTSREGGLKAALEMFEKISDEVRAREEKVVSEQ